MPVKIAFIGAGSVEFTRTLVRDVLTVPELQDTHFAFHDIDKHNLDMITEVCRKDLRVNKLPAKLTSTLTRKRALEGADYVVNCVRIGGLDAYEPDIEIPLKYGVDQCIGDTLCVGGIMYAQRGIPYLLAFTRDARDVAADGCIFLNYANPMAMNTWALNDAYDRGEGVRPLGICHGVQGGEHQIAKAIEALINKGKKPTDRGYKTVTRDEIGAIAAGINHQTWFLQALYAGKDWVPRLLEAFESHPRYSKTEKVRIDVLRRFGYYSTESNGHLSEYLPWYRKRPREIRRWISLDHWIYGETGGYLRFSREQRDLFEEQFKQLANAPGELLADYQRSVDHGSRIIEALETNRPYRAHLNVRNGSSVTNLPADCIVEVPCYVDRNGVSVTQVGDLPLACAATCIASINVQRMSKEAAQTGDVMLLKQAMLHDPLTAAVCNPEEIWQMADELLVAQAAWTPQFKKKDIEAAKTRLKNPTVKTQQWRGAARRTGS